MHTLCCRIFSLFLRFVLFLFRTIFFSLSFKSESILNEHCASILLLAKRFHLNWTEPRIRWQCISIVFYKVQANWAPSVAIPTIQRSHTCNSAMYPTKLSWRCRKFDFVSIQLKILRSKNESTKWKRNLNTAII